MCKPILIKLNYNPNSMSIKLLNQSLKFCKQALYFFREVLSNVIVDTIVIDFAEAVFMDNSFAKLYVIRKDQSKKRISEVKMINGIDILTRSNIP